MASNTTKGIKNICLFLVYVYEYFSRMYVSTPCACISHGGQRVVLHFPELEVSCGHWELNSFPLQGQQVLLTLESPPYPPTRAF